jgi:hypothetical protein
MEINPLYPSSPPNRGAAGARSHIERRSGETTTETAAADKPAVSPALDAGRAGQQAQRTAGLIRQRREDGYYHRTEVLREVAARLLESRDLEWLEDVPS